MDVVGAALGDQIQLHAWRERGDIGTAGRRLDLLKGVEVVVRTRRAQSGHVGDVDAVQIEGALVAERSLRVEKGLLAAVVAADVQAVNHHPGNALQRDPGVARRRDRLQLRLFHDRARDDLARLEDRRLGAASPRTVTAASTLESFIAAEVSVFFPTATCTSDLVTLEKPWSS